MGDKEKSHPCMKHQEGRFLRDCELLYFITMPGSKYIWKGHGLYSRTDGKLAASATEGIMIGRGYCSMNISLHKLMFSFCQTTSIKGDAKLPVPCTQNDLQREFLLAATPEQNLPRFQDHRPSTRSNQLSPDPLPWSWGEYPLHYVPQFLQT